MKYIFPFLLFFFISYSQNKPADLTSVEVLLYFGQANTGCSFENRSLRTDPQFLSTDSMVRYYSEDYKTVLGLYEIYSNGKIWKKKEREKVNTYYGDGNVQNMIIITYNSFRDTIYTTKGNKSFFYKDEEFEYFDEGNHFMNAFDSAIKKFFDTDFKAEAQKLKSLKKDSIAKNSLKLNDKIIYGLTKEEFEKEIYPINHTTTQSEKIGEQGWQSFTASFFRDKNFIGFDNNNKTISSVVIETEEIVLQIDTKSLEIGDSYEKISSYFKNSAAKIALETNPYDPTNSKYLEVDFIGNQGRLFLIFEYGKLKEMNVNFISPRYND